MLLEPPTLLDERRRPGELSDVSRGVRQAVAREASRRGGLPGSRRFAGGRFRRQTPFFRDVIVPPSPAWSVPSLADGFPVFVQLAFILCVQMARPVDVSSHTKHNDCHHKGDDGDVCLPAANQQKSARDNRRREQHPGDDALIRLGMLRGRRFRRNIRGNIRDERRRRTETHQEHNRRDGPSADP